MIAECSECQDAVVVGGSCGLSGLMSQFCKIPPSQVRTYPSCKHFDDGLAVHCNSITLDLMSI